MFQIMAIFYNRVQRANPQNRAETKWYPALNALGTVKSGELARQMADETTMNPKEAEIALYELAKTLKRLLLSGYTVQIDDFGAFYLTAAATGANTREEATAACISAVNVRFRPAADLKAAIAKAEVKPKK
jgi:predicted histone-like DNA-binding protein